MIRGAPAVVLLGLASALLTALLALPAADAFGMGVWGGSIEDLPPCETCCRMCPQYPLPELEDAFGELPEVPEQSANDTTSVVAGTPSATHLSPRSSGETAKCCNVCPGFGIGHPHPLYASFLETGDEPLVQYQPYGFKMPPCCNTCALKSSGQPSFDTLLNKIGARKARDAPYPYNISIDPNEKNSSTNAVPTPVSKPASVPNAPAVKAAPGAAPAAAAAAAAPTAPAGAAAAAAPAGAALPANAAAAAAAAPAGAAPAAAAAPDQYPAFFVELDADSESEMEEPEYTSFLQSRMALQTSAKFELYIGRAAATATNPEAMCKTPLTVPNQEICCNGCNLDAKLAFPPISSAGIIAAQAGTVSRAKQMQDQVNKLVEELLIASGGNRVLAQEMATKQANALRAQSARERRTEDVERKVLEMRAKERDRVLKILVGLENSRPLTPQSSLSIKILSSVLARLNAELAAPGTPPETPTGLRNYRFMTWEEYMALKALPASQRAAVDKLIGEGMMRVDRALRTLPNGTIVNKTGCDDVNITADSQTQTAQVKSQQEANQIPTLVPLPGIAKMTPAVTSNASNTPAVDMSTDVHKAIQASQELVDINPNSPHSKALAKELEKAAAADPANVAQQAKFAPQVNADHELATAVKSGAVNVPATEGVPAVSVKTDGTVQKNPLDWTATPTTLSDSALAYQKQIIETLQKGGTVDSPIDRQQNSELNRLSKAADGNLLSSIKAVGAEEERKRIAEANKPLSNFTTPGQIGAVTVVTDPAERIRLDMLAQSGKLPGPKPPVFRDRYAPYVRYQQWGNVTNSTQDFEIDVRDGIIKASLLAAKTKAAASVAAEAKAEVKAEAKTVKIFGTTVKLPSAAVSAQAKVKAAVRPVIVKA